MTLDEVQETIWQHGRSLYRSMPWREDPSFYNVLISEIMLQQTQVERVRVKYAEFLEAFPTIHDLAAASLGEVLRVWQGLGYNRRAKFLHDAAKEVVAKGAPESLEGLITLPGIGKNTAGAIMNYVYERPTAFIETNVRTVYFHHLFEGKRDVSDKELLLVVEQTMDREHPREWFYALMDYGSFLKRSGKAGLDMSAHYKKQSPLNGSVREVRGAIIRVLAQGSRSMSELRELIGDDGRYEAAYKGLLRDGLIIEVEHQVELTN